MTDIVVLIKRMKAAAVKAKDDSKPSIRVGVFLALELVEALENEIAMRQQNLDIKLNLRQQISELELRHRQRDREDFVRGITHPASLYTADEVMEAIAEYDRTH
ncbi:hypothetical protein Q2T70_20140 [Klebsiella oxytoca]|uniref:hypothetical protein n=1 Tax=Klebsiella oxytoca TaxID=571 RepID=UPI00265FBBED|nr:hypothetical protein [Klebsiella oxytoca]WKM70682.1 hypothetical protein Q2T70_20140 [Klebsiella oxytoca]